MNMYVQQPYIHILITKSYKQCVVHYTYDVFREAVNVCANTRPGGALSSRKSSPCIPQSQTSKCTSVNEASVFELGLHLPAVVLDTASA